KPPTFSRGSMSRYFEIIAIRQLRKRRVRLRLIPEYRRGDVILERQILSIRPPAERLDRYPQIALEANRIHDVPAIQPESLLTAIQPIGFDHLWQARIGRRKNAIFALWKLEIPRAAEVVFCSSAANGRKFVVAIHEKLDLAFAPPAVAVDTP